MTRERPTKARYEREDTRDVLPVINNVINVINAMKKIIIKSKKSTQHYNFGS